MKIDRDQVMTLLAGVADPLTGQNIVVSGRIREVHTDQGQVRCTLAFAKPLDTKQKASLNFACIHAINEVYPDIEVHIHLENQSDPSRSRSSILPQVREIIAVASGKGGVGKSTVSTNLALGLVQSGFKVGILDADLYGPSIPTMLGLEGQRPQVKKVHGKQKIVPLEAFGLPVISIGFVVEPAQAVVLRGPRLGGILKQFLEECIWPELDYLIIDLPPGTGDIQLTLVQTVPLTGVVIVTTPQKVAVADALKAMNMFKMPSVDVPILGVVENMSWFTPAELPENKYHLFGKGGGKHLAKQGGVEVLGQIPIFQGIMEAGEAGKPAVADDRFPQIQSIWRRVTQQVIEKVAYRNKHMAPSKIVQVNT